MNVNSTHKATVMVMAAEYTDTSTDTIPSEEPVTSIIESAESTSPETVYVETTSAATETTKPETTVTSETAVPETIVVETSPPRADSRDADIEMIARIVHAEARADSEAGQRAVACVILNRVESGYFPDTVYDVVFESGQFSTAGGVKYYSGIPENCYRSAVAVYDGLRELPRNALFFKSDSCHANWSYTVWGTIGGNTFYLYGD